MDINNLLALDSNKQNYPNINLPSDAKYYVSAEEYNVLVKALQSWITDYNAKAQALEDSVYRLPIVTVDSAAPLSDENILSSTRTLLEIIKELAKLDGKFLSSLTPDTAEGEITFKKGLSIGDDKNGEIDNYGNAELNSLKLRQWLEVPELRFNRVEVQLGDKWRSSGGGTIESVDLANEIITLKLADGEIGAVAAGDLCVGMFHSMNNENNAAADVDDGKNNRSISGFATCYFKVKEITETAKNSKFKYELRPISGNYSKQIPPEAFMSFAVFGNTDTANRQSSVFESRTYQRFLINVNDWEIKSHNVAAQFGELSNLVALGLPNMSGYSAYLKNVYFSGTIFQVKPPRMMDGTWWEWDEHIQKYVDTGVKVAYPGEAGKAGKDGKDIEYVFTRTRTSTAPNIPQTNDAVPSGWTANPVGVDNEWKYEWYIKRVKIDGVWSPWHYLQEWRHHVADGHHGKDGANREYIYIVNNDPNFNIAANRPTDSPPNIDDYEPSGWSDDPINPGPENQYEWYCYRDKTGGEGNGIIPGTWGPWQGPYLWTRYGKDGDKGEPGNDGSSAPLLYLSTSSQIMTCTTSNVPHPDQTIHLEAKTQNIVIDDLRFQAIAYWTDPQLGLQYETVNLEILGVDNRKRYLTNEQWKPEYEKVEIKAYLGSLNDDVTIHRLADPVEGSNAVVGFLTNGNITFSGLSDGTIINLGISSGGQYQNGHGEFWVYEGLQRQTTGVEFDVIEQTRCQVELLSNGVYKITGYTVTDLDSASAVLQATYNGVIIEQVLTISVSRAGKVGEAGTNVPIVYRGVYSPTATYYGNSARVDIVKIEGNPTTYYRTYDNIGAITGISPTNNSNYWVNFGANFESVATDLLLAERANIGGFAFYKDQIISQYGRYVTNGDTANFSDVPEANIANWYPNIVLDGLGGELVINSATVRGNIEAEKGKIGGWLIGENTFTSQLASYTTDPMATPIDSGNLSYVQVTFYDAATISWVNTYTQGANNKWMRIRYGDQDWSLSPDINFVEAGPSKITNIYEKHLQYEFGISSGLTTFPSTWHPYPVGLESGLSTNNYLWIRQRPYQHIFGKPPVIGLWSKPFRVSPIIMANAISPNISLDGNTGEAIFSGGKVKFNHDGSGHIANKNISWDAAGNAEYKGKITSVASSGGTRTVIDSSGLKVFNASGDMNIEFGIVNGYAVMRYYDNNGELLYDLGPTGLSMIDVRQSEWIPMPNMLYLGTDYTTILKKSFQIYKEPWVYPMVTLYKYQCAKLNGVLSGTLEEKEHNGLVFMEANHNASKVSGIYVRYDVELMQMLTGGTGRILTGSQFPMLHADNETIYDRGTINMIPFRKYLSGVEYREVNAYWNTSYTPL